jgi:squalene synthase HpnD
MTDPIAVAVRGARSNFYIAMRLMPRARRSAMFAIYAFARALDDVADGPQPRAKKHAALDAWRRELADAYGGNPATPVGRSLAAAVARYDLPRAEFDALIDGMAMDIDETMRAPSQAVLDLYCRRVAGSIGVLALSVFGCAGAAERAFAIALGRALQITNIARDMAEDAARGRIYVPREILDQFGPGTLDPATLCRHPGLAAIRARVCDLARAAFAEADSAFAACGGKRRLWPALAMMGVYRRLLDKVDAAPPDAPPMRIARHVQLRIAVRALVLARP